MEFTAVNIGPYDTSTGITFLENLTSIPLVSCNFFDLSGRSLFAQQISTEISSIKVGIVGVSSRPEMIEETYIYKDWQESLPIVLEKLQNTTDFIILLSSLSENENSSILERYPDIRLLISANSNRPNQQPKRVNNGIITQTANRGRYLGQIKFTHPTTNYIHTDKREELTLLQQDSDPLNSSITEQINDLQGDLDLQNKNSPKNLKNQKRSHSIQDDKPPAQYEIRFIPLSEKLPEDEGINTLIDEISNEIKTAKTKNP